jgi:hypothetical protein
MLFITTVIQSTWYPVSDDTKVFYLLLIFTEMGGASLLFVPAIRRYEVQENDTDQRYTSSVLSFSDVAAHLSLSEIVLGLFRFWHSWAVFHFLKWFLPLFTFRHRCVIFYIFWYFCLSFTFSRIMLYTLFALSRKLIRRGLAVCNVSGRWKIPVEVFQVFYRRTMPLPCRDKKIIANPLTVGFCIWKCEISVSQRWSSSLANLHQVPIAWTPRTARHLESYHTGCSILTWTHVTYSSYHKSKYPIL